MASPDRRRHREIGSKLRKVDVAQARPPAEPVNCCHLVVIALHGLRSLPQDHRDIGDFVQRNRSNRRSFVLSEPDEAQNDDDKRGKVEKQDQPAIEEQSRVSGSGRARCRWASRWQRPAQSSPLRVRELCRCGGAARPTSMPAAIAAPTAAGSGKYRECASQAAKAHRASKARSESAPAIRRPFPPAGACIRTQRSLKLP